MELTQLDYDRTRLATDRGISGDANVRADLPVRPQLRSAAGDGSAWERARGRSRVGPRLHCRKSQAVRSPLLRAVHIAHKRGYLPRDVQRRDVRV